MAGKRTPKPKAGPTAAQFERGYKAKNEGGRFSRSGRGDDFSAPQERVRDRREDPGEPRGEDLTGDERTGRGTAAPQGTLSEDDGYGAASGPPYRPGASPKAPGRPPKAAKRQKQPGQK